MLGVRGQAAMKEKVTEQPRKKLRSKPAVKIGITDQFVLPGISRTTVSPTVAGKGGAGQVFVEQAHEQNGRGAWYVYGTC